MTAVSRWDVPAVAGKTVQGRRAGRTVSELEDVERRTQQEAHAKGHAAGLAAARAESQQALNQIKTQVANMETDARRHLRNRSRIWIRRSKSSSCSSPSRSRDSWSAANCGWIRRR